MSGRILPIAEGAGVLSYTLGDWRITSHFYNSLSLDSCSMQRSLNRSLEITHRINVPIKVYRFHIIFKYPVPLLPLLSS